MQTLTVFTPAYNRAHTIGRTYKSLCSQKCKDFVWLIVDDGSTDNTAELVKTGCQKITASKFSTYIKKTAVCIPHTMLRIEIYIPNSILV